MKYDNILNNFEFEGFGAKVKVAFLEKYCNALEPKLMDWF